MRESSYSQIRKRRNKKLYLSFLLVFILPILLLTFFSFSTIKAIKSPNSTNSEKKSFSIKQGEGAGDIAERLEDEGLVKSSFSFLVYINWKRVGDKIQTGEYEIPQNLTVIELAEIITKGKISTNKITIPEGWDLNKISDRVEAKGIATKTEFLAQAKVHNYKADYDFLAGVPDDADLEGFLYPDTYQFSKNVDSDEIIKKMLDNFKKKYDTLKKEVPNSKISTYELITLASIVEREVAKPDDRKLVASVFWNRLEVGMPLESCATIQFILKENKQQFTYEETRTPSPYNTYLNKDLPPGPIGNPSLDSIKAAANPPDSNYLYFLSSKGTTYFSKTFSEHESKKARYLD